MEMNSVLFSDNNKFKREVMKKYVLIIISFALMAVYSCEESTDMGVERAVTNSIYATFEDGTGFFNPEGASPYGETITFVFSTHFPAESDNVTDISRMKLKAYSPVSVNSGVIDLTKETEITIVEADGTQTKHRVVGEIRKSSVAQITSFELPGANLPGYVIEDKKIIGLVSGGINISAQKPKLTLSPHTTISPDTALVQDFSKAVAYTVKAEDGTEVVYTVKPYAPTKLASGIRKGSGRMLWSKKMDAMGLNAVDHMTTSIAISGDYLVTNTRNVANKYYNRFNGEYVGEMTMGDILNANLKNFFITNDDKGNILVCNLCTAAGQDFVVSKWNGPNDSNPVNLIKWKTDITGAQVGRKMSVKGDLDGDALIYIGASKSNNTILRWQVKGGVVQSQAPEKIIYAGAKKWDLYADIVPTGTQTTDKVFISSYPADFVCTDLVSGEVFGQLNLTASGYLYNHSIDYTTFNNTPYLAAINIASYFVGYSYLYDVTNPALLSTVPTSADYSKVCVLKSDAINSNSNGNATGDVLLKVSDDGYKLIMYMFVTNGGVNAYEFDCIDIDNL